MKHEFVKAVDRLCEGIALPRGTVRLVAVEGRDCLFSVVEGRNVLTTFSIPRRDVCTEEIELYAEAALETVTSGAVPTTMNHSLGMSTPTVEDEDEEDVDEGLATTTSLNQDNDVGQIDYKWKNDDYLAQVKEDAQPEGRLFNVFVYGELADADLRRELFGEDVPFEIAQLDDFVLANVLAQNGTMYPTIQMAQGQRVVGLILTLTKEQVDVADDYEDMYRRIIYPVQGEQCFIYVLEVPAQAPAMTEEVAPAARSKVDPFEIQVGIQVEFEHTTDLKAAEKIALQHLAEDPIYYWRMYKAGLATKEELGDQLWDAAQEKWGKADVLKRNEAFDPVTFVPKLSETVTFAPHPDQTFTEQLGGGGGPADQGTDTIAMGMAGGTHNAPVKEDDDEDVDEMMAKTDTGGVSVTPPEAPATGAHFSSGTVREGWFDKKKPCKNCGEPTPEKELRNGNCRKCDNEVHKPKSVPGKDFNESSTPPNHLCKAVFMAGGPASGKTTIANKLFKIRHHSDSLPTSEQGWRIVNTDDMFELLARYPDLQAEFDELDNMEKRPYNLKGDDMDLVQGSMFPLARELMKKVGNSFVAQREPVIIDGTGRHYASIKTLKDRLEELGYDCSMVMVHVDLETALRRNRDRDRVVPEDFVRKAHRQVNANVEKFRELFGDWFHEIQSADPHLDAKKAADLGQAILDRELQNENGKEWLVLHRLMREAEVVRADNPTYQGEPVGLKDKPDAETDMNEADTVDGASGSKAYTSAVAVVLKDDDVLVGRAKSEDDRNGKLCFPGGGIDPEDGADPLAAAKREAFEETSLEVRPQYIVDHPEKPGVAFVVCQYVSGQPEANQEFTSLQWLPIEAAKYGEFPDVYPTNRQILWRLEVPTH